VTDCDASGSDTPAQDEMADARGTASAPSRPALRFHGSWRGLRKTVLSRRFLTGATCAALIALALSLLSHFELLPEDPEHWSADQRTARLSPRNSSQDSRLALVLITDRTLAKFPYSEPVNRGMLADLVKAVGHAHPKVIGIDLVFDRRTEPSKDEYLIAVLRDVEAPIVLGELDKDAQLTEEQLTFQQNFLSRVGRPSGHLYLDVNHPRLVISDHVVRFMVEKDRRKSLPRILAEAGGYVERAQSPILGAIFPASDRISWLLPPTNGSLTFLTVTADTVLDLVDRQETDLIQDMLKGRIVVLGADISDRDQHFTPLSVLTDGRFPGIFVQAQIVAQLIDHRWIYVPNWGTEFFALLAIAGAGFYLGSRYSLWREEFIVEAIGATILIAIGWLAFAATNLVVPYTSLLLAWLAGSIAGHHRHWLLARVGLREQPAPLCSAAAAVQNHGGPSK
jgi:adenylate cyclase